MYYDLDSIVRLTGNALDKTISCPYTNRTTTNTNATYQNKNYYSNKSKFYFTTENFTSQKPFLLQILSALKFLLAFENSHFFIFFLNILIFL